MSLRNITIGSSGVSETVVSPLISQPISASEPSSSMTCCQDLQLSFNGMSPSLPLAHSPPESYQPSITIDPVGSKSGLQVNIESDLQANIEPDLQVNIEPDLQVNIAPDPPINTLPSPVNDTPSPSFSAMLHNVLCLNPLPYPWVIVSDYPVILCRMKIKQHKHVEVDFTIRADETMKYFVFFREQGLNSTNYPLLNGLPSFLESALFIVNKLNESKVCSGNSDDKFITLYKQRAVTIHGISSKIEVHKICSI